MQPLLSKKPSHVMLHVGTNDEPNKDATADSILNGLLDIKKDIEAKLPNVTVTISTPIRRTDQTSAGKIIEEINNIGSKEIGHRGLHLDEKGVSNSPPI